MERNAIAMQQVSELHNQAMDLAGQAASARMHGDYASFQKFTAEAFAKESMAAWLLEKRTELEPTRSVLFRSAATIALEAGETREAERLISAALVGNPPYEIAKELRSLLENVNFARNKK